MIPTNVWNVRRRENRVWEFNGTSKITTSNSIDMRQHQHSTFRKYSQLRYEVVFILIGIDSYLILGLVCFWCFCRVFGVGLRLCIRSTLHSHRIAPRRSLYDTIITFNSDRMRIYCFYVFLLHDKWMRMFLLLFSIFSIFTFSQWSSLFSIDPTHSCSPLLVHIVRVRVNIFEVRKVHFHLTNFIMWQRGIDFHSSTTTLPCCARYWLSHEIETLVSEFLHQVCIQFFL